MNQPFHTGGLVGTGVVAPMILARACVLPRATAERIQERARALFGVSQPIKDDIGDGGTTV